MPLRVNAGVPPFFLFLLRIFATVPYREGRGGPTDPYRARTASGDRDTRRAASFETAEKFEPFRPGFDHSRTVERPEARNRRTALELGFESASVLAADQTLFFSVSFAPRHDPFRAGSSAGERRRSVPGAGGSLSNTDVNIGEYQPGRGSLQPGGFESDANNPLPLMTGEKQCAGFNTGSETGPRSCVVGGHLSTGRRTIAAATAAKVAGASNRRRSLARFHGPMARGSVRLYGNAIYTYVE